ncbi:MAG: hypothetical protein U9R56_04075, partial [candidate division Zixibacteria bacterium]|nr:hypothetical protein [candidate division Zixibacteria bacterium]
FELGLTKAGYAGGLLYGVEVSYPFFHGVAILFGFLIVSCIIILCSSVLALAIEKVIALGGVRRKAASTVRRIFTINPAIGFTIQKVYLVPEVRGPPSSLP